MLKTVKVSTNRKTGPIAVTYRSGEHNVFGTCPKTCGLNPAGEHSAGLVDSPYLAAIVDSVPRGGLAWTYSHFALKLLPKPQAGKTVINASCDTEAQAVQAVKAGYPATLAASSDSAEQWPKIIDGVRFARCPAELSESFTCDDCGGDRPLCARGDRDYVIVFVGHGTGAKLVGADESGGCYGAQGFVRMVWNNTKKTGARDDAKTVKAFAESLPVGSKLRHHIVGDMGLAQS